LPTCCTVSINSDPAERNPQEVEDKFMIDPTLSALIGSAIGATGALAGSTVVGLIALRNESRRRADARQLAYATAVRSQVGGRLRALFALHHSMTWLTWYAKNHSQRLDRSLVEQYDTEAHLAIPGLMSEVAVVASLDFQIWQKLVALVNRLLDLDEAISMHCSSAVADTSQDRDEAIAALATIHDRLRPTMEEAVAEISNLLRDQNLHIHR
jgi:hypothetical protein